MSWNRQVGVKTSHDDICWRSAAVANRVKCLTEVDDIDESVLKTRVTMAPVFDGGNMGFIGISSVGKVWTLKRRM